jgi:hypothetical protein
MCTDVLSMREISKMRASSVENHTSSRDDKSSPAETPTTVLTRVWQLLTDVHGVRD